LGGIGFAGNAPGFNEVARLTWRLISLDRVGQLLWLRKLKDSVLDPAKQLINFFDTGSRIQKVDRLHSREVVFFGIEPVANWFRVTQDGERVLVKHGKVVQRVGFAMREPALLAPAAQGPAVNADNIRESRHRYAEKRSQLFQPFDREAASDLFAYGLWGFDSPLDRFFEARAHR